MKKTLTIFLFLVIMACSKDHEAIIIKITGQHEIFVEGKKVELKKMNTLILSIKNGLKLREQNNPKIEFDLSDGPALDIVEEVKEELDKIGMLENIQ